MRVECIHIVLHTSSCTTLNNYMLTLRTNLLDPPIETNIDRACLLNILHKHLILRIQRHKVLCSREDIIPTARQKVQRDNSILLRLIQRLTINLHSNESPTAHSVRVVLYLDARADLEEGCDFFPVFDVDVGHDAFDDVPHIGAGELDFDDGVAEGEGGEDFAAGDFARINGGADTACIDECESDIWGASFAIVEHSISHVITEETLLLLASCLIQLHVGGSEDFTSKLGKGLAPSINLLLQSLVLFGRIGHVDRGTVVGENLAVTVVRYVDVADVFAPAVCGHDEDFLAILVLGDGGVGAYGVGHVAERGVAVATHDEVQTGSGGSELLVLVVTDVRDSGDASDVRLALDLIDRILHRLDSIRESGAVSRLGDTRRIFRRNPNEGKSLVGENVVRLNGLVERRVRRLDVGGHDGDVGQVLQEVSKLVVAAVELVVAEGHGIESQLVQRLGNLLTAIIRVEERALELIAHVQPQAVVVFGTLGVDCVLDARVAPEAATLGPGAVGSGAAVLVEMCVNIIDMEEGWDCVSEACMLAKLQTHRCCSCPESRFPASSTAGCRGSPP